MLVRWTLAHWIEGAAGGLQGLSVPADTTQDQQQRQQERRGASRPTSDHVYKQDRKHTFLITSWNEVTTQATITTNQQTRRNKINIYEISFLRNIITSWITFIKTIVVISFKNKTIPKTPTKSIARMLFVRNNMRREFIRFHVCEKAFCITS